MKVSGQLQAPAALSPERSPVPTPLESGYFREKRNLWNPPGFEAQTQQPAANALSAETLAVSLK